MEQEKEKYSEFDSIIENFKEQLKNLKENSANLSSGIAQFKEFREVEVALKEGTTDCTMKESGILSDLRECVTYLGIYNEALRETGVALNEIV